MRKVGYSKKNLAEKLGIKKRSRIAIVAAPHGYISTIERMVDVNILNKIEGVLDLIQFFAKEKSELEYSFPIFKKSIARDGMIWISWPKGTSKIETDLNENIIRDTGLENGLVDVKVIAIDQDWSGLKFVYRLKDR